MSVSCVIVDGPTEALQALEAADDNAACDVIRGLSDLATVIPGKFSWLHTLRCAAATRGVEPRVTFQGVEVFAGQSGETSARQVLDGVIEAIRLNPAVICVPSAIAETTLEGRFATVCKYAQAMGIAVVAAWPRLIARPVPAVLPSTIPAGQIGRNRAFWCQFLWSHSLNMFQGPFSASMNASIIAGLAVAHVVETRNRHPIRFQESLKRFIEDSDLTEMLSPCKLGKVQGQFVFEEYAPAMGEAYRTYLRSEIARE